MEADSLDHIAILVCDTSIAGVSERYGDFGDNVDSLLRDAQNAKYRRKKYQVAYEKRGEDNEWYGEELLKVYEELNAEIGAGHVKGIILTGSRSDSFADGVLWIDFLDKFLQNVVALDGFPIVGICFGHQIIAKNLGCKVGRSLPEIGWECGTTTISLNRDVIAMRDSPFVGVLEANEEGAINDHLNLLEIHQDVVFGLPPPAILEKRKTSVQSIGSSSKCSIQGLITVSGPMKVLTFQGHPEFSVEEAIALMEGLFESGRFSKSFYEKCVYNTKILNNQGILMGQVINNFINFWNNKD